MGDGVKAMIKWCNDQGGINGRQIIGHFYDAKISLANNVMTQACNTDFMMVGEGFAADGAAEATRVKCNMVAVPGLLRARRLRQRPDDVPGRAEPRRLHTGFARTTRRSSSSPTR